MVHVTLTCYLTADTLGSTRMITDETATPRECHDYLPFGDEIGRTAGCYAAHTTNTLKFTGKMRDAETGNDYFGARYLSAAQMRWTIPDWSARGEPVPYANRGDPQTLNLYAYVRNNPQSRVDLDGHDQMTGPTPDTVCTVYVGSCKGVAPSPSKQSQAQQQSQPSSTGFFKNLGQRFRNAFHGRGFKTDDQLTPQVTSHIFFSANVEAGPLSGGYTWVPGSHNLYYQPGAGGSTGGSVTGGWANDADSFASGPSVSGCFFDVVGGCAGGTTGGDTAIQGGFGFGKWGWSWSYGLLVEPGPGIPDAGPLATKTGDVYMVDETRFWLETVPR